MYCSRKLLLPSFIFSAFFELVLQDRDEPRKELFLHDRLVIVQLPDVAIVRVLCARTRPIVLADKLRTKLFDKENGKVALVQFKRSWDVFKSATLPFRAHLPSVLVLGALSLLLTFMFLGVLLPYFYLHQLFGHRTIARDVLQHFSGQVFLKATDRQFTKINPVRTLTTSEKVF